MHLVSFKECQLEEADRRHGKRRQPSRVLSEDRVVGQAFLGSLQG